MSYVTNKRTKRKFIAFYWVQVKKTDVQRKVSCVLNINKNYVMFVSEEKGK